MDYFLLTQDQRVSNIVEPQGLAQAFRRDEVERLSPDEVEGYDLIEVDVKEKPDIEYVDFIERPVPSVSDRLYQLWTRFEKRIVFTPIMLADLKRETQRLYWSLNPPKVDCLGPTAEFNKNGTMKRLVIDAEKVKDFRIFRVGRIMENLVVLNLIVAESLLRRDMTGYRLNPVELESSFIANQRFESMGGG